MSEAMKLEWSTNALDKLQWDATSNALRAGDDSLTWRITVEEDGGFYVASSSPELLTAAGYCEEDDAEDAGPCWTLRHAKQRCEVLEQRIRLNEMTREAQDNGEY
jgi:hypothetical protein